MKWTDIQQIAEELADKHPDVDPTLVRFVDLHNYVVSLDGFDDDRWRAPMRARDLHAPRPMRSLHGRRRQP